MTQAFGKFPKYNWHAEYGAHMVEGTPRNPFKGFMSNLLSIQRNMELRRIQLHKVLNPNEISPTISSFPMLGVKSYPHTLPVNGSISQSKYLSDRVIGTHPRFSTLTTNIRERRQGRVNISIPLYGSNATTDNLYLDSMAFGMGCSCLQVTQQCANEKESRFLHDQLLVIAPLLTALSAATPAMHGHLLDWDTRTDVISQSVDDRTPAERSINNNNNTTTIEGIVVGDPYLAGHGVKSISSSRYSPSPLYLTMNQSEDSYNSLNDILAEVDEEVYTRVYNVTGDAILARHITHLFIRDPLVLYENEMFVNNSLSSCHFDNIQGSNWMSVRWKPPLASPLESEGDDAAHADADLYDPDYSYKVEFRSLELQLTDFENSAFLTFVILLSRAVIHYDVSLHMPISEVMDNFNRSKFCNAVMKQKFFFRSNVIISNKQPSDNKFQVPSNCSTIEMSMFEIMSGNAHWIGMVPLIQKYLKEILLCDDVRYAKIDKYLSFLIQRSSGEIPTCAQWMRGYLENHPTTNGNKISSQAVNELLILCDAIGMGRAKCSQLLGEVTVSPLDFDNSDNNFEILDDVNTIEDIPL